jgi:hypothetical protein
LIAAEWPDEDSLSLSLSSEELLLLTGGSPSPLLSSLSLRREGVHRGIQRREVLKAERESRRTDSRAISDGFETERDE